MTYSKEVTALILSDWAKGVTAVETQTHLRDVLGKTVSTPTIYRHRHSLTTQDLIDELLRQQERDIITVDSKKLAMHYRNELLKILLPVRIEQLSMNINKNTSETTVKHVVELVDPDTINASDTV